MNTRECCGYKNYETAQAIILGDNVEKTSRKLRLLAEHISALELDKEVRIEGIAAALKSYMENNNPLDGNCDIYSTLLQAGIDEIDYYEWAEHLLSAIGEA